MCNRFSIIWIIGDGVSIGRVGYTGFMSQLIIRDLESKDVDAAVGIAKRAWEPIFESFLRLIGEDVFPKVYPDWRAGKERQIRSAVAGGPPAFFLVAEEEGTVVGFASYHLNADSKIGEIGNNAVDPDHQNRGIGALLHAKALERMRSAGMEVAKVTTGLDESHAPARSAYKKSGFTNSIPMTTYYQRL